MLVSWCHHSQPWAASLRSVHLTLVREEGNTLCGVCTRRGLHRSWATHPVFSRTWISRPAVTWNRESGSQDDDEEGSRVLNPQCPKHASHSTAVDLLSWPLQVG